MSNQKWVITRLTGPLRQSAVRAQKKKAPQTLRFFREQRLYEEA